MVLPRVGWASTVTISVEWRLQDGRETLVLVDPDSGTVSQATPDPTSLKAFLAAAGTLEGWQKAMTWSPVNEGNRDPDNWGELVLSRDVNGDVISIDPELFWERVHRHFRSKGTDFTS
jgi:hypothetical protein